MYNLAKRWVTTIFKNNPKSLDASFKMDQYFWDFFGGNLFRWIQTLELFWKASFKIGLDFWDCFRGHFKRDLYISGLFGRASFKMDPGFWDCLGGSF